MQSKIIRKSHKSAAFTLLEVLVVISIIGILIALASAAYSTAQKKGRDARRASDIKALQNGFEQFYAKNGVYPASFALAADTAIFPSGLPTDPRDPAAYVTLSRTSDTKYCVCALLENSTGNATGSTGSGDTIACAYSTVGTYYCLSNLQ